MTKTLKEKHEADVGKSASNALLYVVAGSSIHVTAFAKSNGVSPHDTRFINSREKIMGLQNIKIYVLESAKDLVDFHEIMQQAQIYGFKTVYV